MATEFITRAEILSELWTDFRDDEEFMDFIEYNDLGLPLAFAVTNTIVVPTPQLEAMVNETFDLLLAGVGLEDTGFENLEDLLEASSQQ